MKIPPDAACPTGAGIEIVDATTALCQPGLEWQEVAAITEACIRELWPDDLDAETLLPEIRHILESTVAVHEFLDHVRNGNGNPEDNLRRACGRIIRSAASLHKIRSVAKHSQPVRP